MTSLLRPAVRVSRPHIYKLVSGRWACETAFNNVRGTGDTPAQAYQNWFNEVVLLGAKLHRQLRPFA